MSHRSDAEPRAATGGFAVVRGGPAGVGLAIGATLDPGAARRRGATAGLDLADVVLVEPYRRGTSAQHVAEAPVHVRGRPS
ncbi:hypothetical protein ACFVW1_27025 [Streptomyces olivochromogenes]|uniref:hypothetical protein n=1 Tax=Streptomyces olivochromogenes TaxID=1963 RepID=UPI0036DA90A2